MTTLPSPGDARRNVPRAEARQNGFGDFFRYHGWLSPGVRLFRKIGFQAKALWVSVAFLAPLVMALVFLAAGANEQVDFAASERQGVRMLRPVLELAAAAQDRRRSAAGGDADLAALQDKVKAAFAKVQARARRGRPIDGPGQAPRGAAEGPCVAAAVAGRVQRRRDLRDAHRLHRAGARPDPRDQRRLAAERWTPNCRPST